ncbi:MAG: DUF5696 domain-containing protein [Defluviitaleaceae bacterium]|nr:DUF5696 domain-containing protein [Defluviitaleaceae bacterium]
MYNRTFEDYKKFWLAKLRFWAVIAVIVLVLFGIRVVVTHGRLSRLDTGDIVSDSAHPVRFNEDLERLHYNGVVVLIENENLTFAVDFSDGNIEVTNRASGYVWRSKPSPEEMYLDTSNNLWQNIAQSPIYVEFVNTIYETLQSMLHVGSPGYMVDVFRLPDGAGIRVYYQFANQGIAVALDFYLHHDHLEVDMPNYMVRERPMTYIMDGRRLVHDPTQPSALIFNIRVLPFFGASQDRDIYDNVINGFMFIPDGPGALIRFDEHRDFFNVYSGAVYGSDFSFFSVINNAIGQQRWFPRIHFPVFGINRGADSLLAVIHQGESNANINAYPAGVRTTFNNVHAQFNYRVRYMRFHNMIGDGTMRFTESSANSTRNIRYFFLTGDDAGYVGMAAAYRQYLMDVKGLNRRPSGGDIPMELSIYGGDREASFLISPFITMTTFDQGKEIVQFFADNGVTQMNILYNAWYRDGNAARFPNRFPPASQLGGRQGLRSFVEFAHEHDFSVFLTDWNFHVQSTRGIVRSRDVIYDIQDTPLNWGTFANPMYVLNPAAMRRIAERSLEEYRRLGIDGIMEFSSEYLISNQGQANRMHREEVKREIRALYQHMSDELGRIYLWRGMTFGVVDGAAVVDPANTFSFSPLINEYVPFYHIAFRGLIDLITVPVNTMANPEVTILQAAEHGMNLSFILTYAPTEYLFFAYNSWMLTSSQFDIFKYSFLELYNRWNYIFADVKGQFIVNHENIADNIFRTTYENGFQVIVNYRNEAFEYEGVSIPALNFAIRREGQVYIP